ncbi:hypothetical protein [Comamonas sp. C24C]
MSTNERTPGPWLHRGKSDSVHKSPSAEQYAQGYRFGETIFQFHEESPPSDADLALILAAPELLHALQESLSALEYVVEQAGGPACEHEGGVVCFCKENTAISEARTAISKAIGEHI